MRSGERCAPRDLMALHSYVKCREQGRWLLSKARLQTRLKIQAHNRQSGDKQLVPKPTGRGGPITSPGRPSEYNGEETCKLAKNMARAGLSHTMMARIFGIAPSTFSLWKAQHPAFLKALEQGTNKSTKRSRPRRSSGHSATATKPRKPSKPG